MRGDVTMNLMEVDVLRMLRYCRMSGTVISLSALRNLRPAKGLVSTLVIGHRECLG